MTGSQLDELVNIFKREKMSVSVGDIVTPPYLDIKWEVVGPQNIRSGVLS